MFYIQYQSEFKIQHSNIYLIFSIFFQNQLTNNDQVTEMLKVCLQKVCELQAELQRSDGQEHDAEAAGYAACAIEALRFLSSEGVSQEHPMVKTLTQHLLRDRDQDY